MKTPAPTPKDIAELVAFLPQLYASDISPIVKWGGGMDKETGLIFLPAPDYADVVQEFFEAASKDCWTDPDYLDRDVNQILAQEDGLATANIDEIKSVLTFCVRGERFCDGHWAAMIEAGHVKRLLQRLVELGSEGPEAEEG